MTDNEAHEFALYFDGACEPKNPGGVATYGWALMDDSQVVSQDYGFVLEGPGATNNMAEWTALVRGVEAAATFNPSMLVIRGDSQLVVKQLRGDWSIHAEHLAKYRARAVAALSCPWRVEWIPREQNGLADSLSRLAYIQHRSNPQ